jgi:hypothetical protein
MGWGATMRFARTVSIGLGLVLAAVTFDDARAEVLDVQASGFSVREVVRVAVPPTAAWATLVRPSSWWSPEHTYSHDAGNLTLDPRPGGRWIEALPGGGGVEHLTVVYADPPRLLRLEGGLGPMQALGGTGHLTVDLAPADGGTVITAVYDFGGHEQGGFAGLAPVVDRVLAEQFTRLKAASERPARQP